MTRDPDRGVVLFNVLVIVAFMSLVVMAMVTMGDLAISRSQRFSEAGQATLYANAGEQSAMAALQQDLTDAPDTDTLTEPWAGIAQERIEIEGGYFALDITDAQRLYNLNNLRPSADFGAPPPDTRLLAVLAANLDLAADVTSRIGRRMAEDPPVTAVFDLAAEQIVSAAEAAALATVATVLPLPTEINLNTAPLPVLTALTGNAPQARLLDSIRTREGFLTPADLSTARLAPDSRSGFTSAFFSVSVAVAIGGTEQIFNSLIYRNAKAKDDIPLRLVSRVRQMSAAPEINVQTAETFAAAPP